MLLSLPNFNDMDLSQLKEDLLQRPSFAHFPYDVSLEATLLEAKPFEPLHTLCGPWESLNVDEIRSLSADNYLAVHNNYKFAASCFRQALMDLSNDRRKRQITVNFDNANAEIAKAKKSKHIAAQCLLLVETCLASISAFNVQTHVHNRDHASSTTSQCMRNAVEYEFRILYSAAVYACNVADNGM